MDQLFSSKNPVFTSFALHVCVLFLKMMAVVVCTLYYRNKKSVCANEEDLLVYDPTGKKELPVIRDDEDVERMRRIHLNDMENIYPFIFLGLIYVTTKPDITVAVWLFRFFTGFRILHSLVYVCAVRPPARAFCFVLNVLVNIYMTSCIVRHYFVAL